MSVSKETAIRQLKNSSAANQQALVKRMIKKVAEPVKMVIPGGINLFEEVDATNIHEAVYTWLRRVREFSEVRLSLARDPNAYRLKKKKVESFEKVNGGPMWLDKNFGKRKLAEVLGNALLEYDVVLLEATAEGIFVYEDTDGKFNQKSEDFEPYLEFDSLRKQRQEYVE